MAGTFIELGGNDGIQQSNSFFLERELGWRGILIEGVPELAAEAARNRPLATVVCAAMAGTSSPAVVAMNNADLVSSISADAEKKLFVATTSLSKIIDLVSHGVTPELLSIDVEGFEIEVLKGLDLERHRPRWILVETSTPQDVATMLRGYAMTAQLSHHDFLFQSDERPVELP